MNTPPPPPAPVAPPPPAPVAPPPPAPVAPPQVTEATLLQLIKERVVFGQNKVEQEEQAQWALALLKSSIPNLAQLHGSLNNSTTIDIEPLWKEQQKAQAAPAAPVSQPPESTLNPAVTTPPPNPISDSTAAQVAQPPPPDAPPTPGSETDAASEEADPAAWDRLSGTQCKSLRGLKSRLSKTHKVDWKDYCTRFNLDLETGLECGEPVAPPPPPAGAEIPSRYAPPSPGLPTTPTPQGTQAASLPPAPETPQFGAPAAQDSLYERLPTSSYLGAPPQGIDFVDGCLRGVQVCCVWAGGDPIAPEQAEEAFDWLRGAFVGIDGVRKDMVDSQIYAWLRDLHTRGKKGELAPFAPHKRETNLAQAPAVPMFSPPAVPAPAPTPQQSAPEAPVQLELDLVSAAAQGALGPAAQQVAHSMLPPPSQPAPQQQAPQHMAGMSGHSSRHELAHMLGGAIDCIFVPLLDAATADLSGRVDANQLAGLCEAEALRIVTDPQDLKFRKDRQVAENIFSQKLGENPRLYVLIRGWDWVLPEHLVPVLLRRTCSGGIYKNGAFLAFNF